MSLFDLEPQTADDEAKKARKSEVFRARAIQAHKANRMLVEYRKRTGPWCRHETPCASREACDDRTVAVWKARGLL